MEIRFSYKNLQFTYHEHKLENWQMLLGPEADFQIFLDKKLFFEEANFNIGEFATQLSFWANNEMSRGIGFFYNAIESDQPEFLHIQRDNLGWKIGSVFQKYNQSAYMSTDEILLAASQFALSVVHEIKSKFQVDLSPWLTEKFQV